MKKITIINTALLTGIMLNGGLQIHAAAQESYDQKRMICSTAQQNAAATLLQAACRGTLERQFVQHGELVRPAELVRQSEIELARLAEIGLAQSFEVALAEQAENNGAATLIQAGVRGALARGILDRDMEQNDALLSEMQLRSANSAPCASFTSSTDSSSDSSEDFALSEDNEPLNQLLQQNNNDPQEALFDAVRNNRLWAIRDLVQRGASVNAVDGNGLLHAAVMLGNIEMVRTLVAIGANVNAVNQYGSTALLVAVLEGHSNVVQILLEAKADVNIVSQGATALMVAVYAGHTAIVRMLIAYGAVINGVNYVGSTSLLLACSLGYSNVVQVLLEAQANVDIADQNGITPLLLAVSKGHSKVVQMLLEAKADVNIADQNGTVALMSAAVTGNVEISRMLISYGANVDAVDQFGNTLLMQGVYANNIEAVRTLIAVGADVNVAGQNGLTPLLAAVAADFFAMAQMLIEAKADVNIANQGASALLLAAGAGSVEVVRKLIVYGARVDAVNQVGATPLMRAAEAGHSEVVRMLIAAKVDVDAADRNGISSLMVAAELGHAEVVQLLILANANVNAVNQLGNPALMLAAQAGHVAIVRMLIAANADINVVGQFGVTALMAAAGGGSLEVVRVLIAAGATINVFNKNGISTLASASNLEVVQLLIDSYRTQLAKQHPESLMKIFLHDLEQLNRKTTLPAIADAFNQVGEIITCDLSDDDRRNLRNTGCSLFIKAAINGKNGQSPAIKKQSFSEFITSALQKIIVAKETFAGNEQTINYIEKIIPFLKQELAQGYYIRECEVQQAPASANDVCARQMDTESASSARQAAQVPMVADEPVSGLRCAVAQARQQQHMRAADAQMLVADTELEAQSALAAASCAVAQQAAQTALEADRALRAEQEEELAQSEAIDRRKAELEEQIGALTEQVRVLVAGNTIPEQAFDAVVQVVDVASFSFDAVPLEICQKARDLYISIIAARTELIELIQADQTVHEIFVVAKAARLAEQNEMLADERAQLQMAERAIDAHVPTQQELQAMREQRARIFGDLLIDRKGKSPA